MGVISVVRPGLLTTVQDAGRKGYEHLGVMVGGWLDDWAAAWANRLVGNPPDAALLEMTLLGPVLTVDEGGWAALAGANLGAAINGKAWLPGESRLLRAGDEIRFTGPKRGARAYLALAGELGAEKVFGSQSTDLVAKFGGIGGRALKAGDRLTVSGGAANQAWAAPVDTLQLGPVIRVLPGVRVDRFPNGTLERLIGGQFRVSAHSDRVGLRLEGDQVTDAPMASASLSEGMAIGAIEVPPSGELLILLKSRGSIGGYPTLAHVIRADWPCLAQLKPGDTVEFRLVDLAEAEQAMKAGRALLSLPLRSADHRLSSASSSLPGTVWVRSPSWAVAYRGTHPGADPLVRVGDRVEEGQALAVLEVMKTFSDLVTPGAGTVIKVQLTDGQEVQEGDALVLIALDQRGKGNEDDTEN